MINLTINLLEQQIKELIFGFTTVSYTPYLIKFKPNLEIKEPSNVLNFIIDYNTVPFLLTNPTSLVFKSSKISLHGMCIDSVEKSIDHVLSGMNIMVPEFPIYMDRNGFTRISVLFVFETWDKGEKSHTRIFNFRNGFLHNF